LIKIYGVNEIDLTSTQPRDERNELMQGKYCVCPHLVDEAVVDDGAADLLVELEERLHLVDRDLKPNPHKRVRSYGIAT
jgi:hypothetical protein